MKPTKVVPVTRTAAARVAAVAKSSAALIKPPQGRAETAAEKAAGETTGGIVPIKKSALSLDVGPRVIHALFASDTREREIIEELHTLKGAKRYEQLSELAMAIAKAARADHNIDLTAAFSGDTKQMGKLNNQLGVALGFREVKQGEPGKNGVTLDVVVTAQSVKDCFPMPGETAANTPDYTRKKTFASNFLTQLKKCAQVAHASIVHKIDMKMDQKAGTLMISGPAVKKHFGQERVLLDERKTIQSSSGATVELNEKPSFTALANMGAAEQGIAPAVAGAGGAQHRGKLTGTVGGTLAVAASSASTVTGRESLDAAIITICKSLVTALEKATSPLTKHAIAALGEAKNAIDVQLANG